MLQKNFHIQKYTLSDTSFKSVPTGHLKILTHLSICLTIFFYINSLCFSTTLAACHCYHTSCTKRIRFLG